MAAIPVLPYHPEGYVYICIYLNRLVRIRYT